MPLNRYDLSKKLILFTSPLFAFGFSASAQTIHADDNFTNSALGLNQTNVTNTQAVGVGTFQTISATAGQGVVVDPGFGTGQALSFDDSSRVYYRAFNSSAEFSLNSLAVNETLSLSFDIRFEEDPVTDDFSFGFMDYSGSSATSNAVLYANIDLVGDTDHSSFRTRTGSFFMGTAAGADVGSTFTNANFAADTNYTFGLSVKKTADGVFDLSYTVNASIVESVTGVALSTDDLEVDGIAFRFGQNPGGSNYFDNVTVTVIPEPSAASIFLGLGVLGAMLGLRRR